MLTVHRNLSSSQRQLFDELRRTAEQNESNMSKILAELSDIRSIFRVQQNVPPQVLLSKPIVFLDARGRYFGFHIEWVNSQEVNAL